MKSVVYNAYNGIQVTNTELHCRFTLHLFNKTFYGMPNYAVNYFYISNRLTDLSYISKIY